MEKFLISILLVGALASCTTTQTLYSWHDYEDTTYQYSKKRTDELKVKVLDEYRKMIDKQTGSRGTVPPGLCAEYGYMLYVTGKQEDGLKFLKQEIQLYPESEKYISRIIKQLEQ